MLPLAINKICFQSKILAESFKSASGFHFAIFAIAEKIGKKLGLVSRHGYPGMLIQHVPEELRARARATGEHENR